MITVSGWLVALCFWADLLFPPCLGIYALIRWRGGWRVAAAVPLLVALPAAVTFLSTRHGEAGADSPSLLWYVPLSLVLCAYSATVLLRYLNRKLPGSEGTT
jgi:hypothetical protein